MTDATDRNYNFSAGPAALPLSVLRTAQSELLCYPGAGASILEISHRSPDFSAILEEAEHNLRELLGVPDGYHVLFLQGGARLQFSMVPMNLLRGASRPGCYVVSGAWGRMALQEAAREGAVVTVWNGEAEGFRRVPGAEEIRLNKKASYVHMTSNETIHGVQFSAALDVGSIPLVCDASSDFLSRPIDVQRYGLIYACAQKNAGAAGLTVVLVRDDLLRPARDDLASMLDFRRLADAGSRLNTPPVFAIYLFLLITRWLRQEVGGLKEIDGRNRRKAAVLYEVLDSTDFYTGHAETSSRSTMNVVFRLPSEVLERDFLTEAEKRGLRALKGHRSVGGIRASIYNAMPLEGVEALRCFMLEFENTRTTS